MKGVFDPDYRRKGWRNSAFVPRRRGSVGITRLVGAVVVLIWVGLFQFPPTVPLMKTTQGIAISAVIGLIVWIVLAMLIRALEWRGVQDTAPFLEDKGKVEAVSYRDFEHEVADLFEVLTSYKARVIGGAKDGGVDIELYRGDSLEGIVQCKYYDRNKPISPGFLRELDSSKRQYGVELAWLVTTAYFTRESEHIAERLGLTLIGGRRLEDMRQKASKIRSSVATRK